MHWTPWRDFEENSGAEQRWWRSTKRRPSRARSAATLDANTGAPRCLIDATCSDTRCVRRSESTTAEPRSPIIGLVRRDCGPWRGGGGLRVPVSLPVVSRVTDKTNLQFSKSGWKSYRVHKWRRGARCVATFELDARQIIERINRDRLIGLGEENQHEPTNPISHRGGLHRTRRR